MNVYSAQFADRICDLNVFLPVDILWIGGVADGPVVCVELAAVVRALGLPTTLTALTLASVEVFQDSEKKQPPQTKHRHYSGSKPTSQIHIHKHMQMYLRGGYGLVLEGDKGHPQGLLVNLFSLLPVVVF